MRAAAHHPTRIPRMIWGTVLVGAVLVLATGLPAASAEHHPATPAAESEVKTSPADGAELSAPVRSLRVWLDHAPIVEKSSLTLEGPSGVLEVQGLHTMGADDLMARVVGRMPNGKYTAKWTSEDAQGKTSEGSWTFTILRSNMTK